MPVLELKLSPDNPDTDTDAMEINIDWELTFTGATAMATLLSAVFAFIAYRFAKKSAAQAALINIPVHVVGAKGSNPWHVTVQFFPMERTDIIIGATIRDGLFRVDEKAAFTESVPLFVEIEGSFSQTKAGAALGVTYPTPVLDLEVRTPARRKYCSITFELASGRPCGESIISLM